MGTDYYKVLGVEKSASDDDIKKAYKKMALKHHPDRNKGSEESAKKFKQVSEAFEVLSDSNKRAVYDQFGEEGLKGGGAPPGAGAAGGNPFAGFGGFPGQGSGGRTTFSFNGAPGMGSGGFSASDPNDIFSAFFGGQSPFGAASFGGGKPGASMFQGMDMDEDERGFPGGFPGSMPRTSSRPGQTRPRANSASDNDDPATEVTKPLPCTLEELYSGTTKKMKISRKMADGSWEPKVIEIAVKAGWKSGTKIKYRGAGNDEIGKSGRVRAQDLTFVVEEKPHDRFKRDGDDLIYEVSIPLADALAGPTDASVGKKNISSLDKRLLSYTIPYPKAGYGGKPISPGQEIVLRGEGFPAKGGKKGDLRIVVKVTFPSQITANQARAIRDSGLGSA